MNERHEALHGQPVRGARFDGRSDHEAFFYDALHCTAKEVSRRNVFQPQILRVEYAPVEQSRRNVITEF